MRKVTPFPFLIVSKYPPRFIPSITQVNSIPSLKIRLGMEYTGVIDGIIPGGYLLTIIKGNVVKLRMFAYDHASLIHGDGNVNVPLVGSNVSLTQNTRNSEACINLNTSEEIPELQVDDGFFSRLLIL